MIRIENVSVLYGRTVALDDIDVALQPGITGLFGPNASGKSTLLRVIAGLLRPTEGAAYLGQALIRSSDEVLRGRIGYAGHEAGLYARLSVEENLRLFACLYGAPAQRVEEMLEQLALMDRKGTLVEELSAGLKRRAAVARALLHDPDVLLLDEPYANLDDEAADIVSAAIRAWWHADRIGMIATHGAKKVKAFADAGLVLRRGRVAAYGLYRKRSEQGASA
ncbi:MAG: heme ABC exporter ATP-binding protein CcmA [Actinomycetota bacterium]